MFQQQKQDIQILSQFLKELPQEISIQHIKTLKISNSSDRVQKSRVMQTVDPLGIQDIEVFKKLKKQAGQLGEEISEENKDQINNLLQSLTPKYSLGAKLQKVQGIERIRFGEDLSFDKEDSCFSVENGIVYLLDIWATWCKPCQEPMDHNQKMIEMNPDWVGKVKIVAISVNDTTEEVLKKVNFKNWKSIKHYRFLKGWDDENDLFKYLRLQGIPFVILINKWGRIVYLGHPDEENLELRISQELKMKEDSVVFAQENNNKKELETKWLLTKEEFKQLKLKIETLQSALKEAAIEGTVTITLEKVNLWKPDGSKQVLKRSMLTLSYNVMVSSNLKFNSFLEQHWQKIPNRCVKEAKITDPAKQQKDIQDKFKEIFSALGVNINYLPKETTTFSYKKQQISTQSTSGYFVQAENITAELYKQGMENLKEYLNQLEEGEENENIITQELKLLIDLRVGKQFESIENYIKWGTGVYEKIEHIQGQVLLLNYWGQWSGQCDKEIENNTKLLKENQEAWGNNVKAVSLSLGLAEDAKEYMDAHKESQKYIEFYFPKEERQIDTLKYGVQYIPHYVVVDKFGKIRKRLDVENVKELVTKLLSEEAPQQPEENIGKQIGQDSIAKLKIALQNQEINTVFTEIDHQNIMSIELKIISKTLGECLLIEKPQLSYFIRHSQEQQFQVVLEKIFAIIPEESWKISKMISKTVSVQYPGKVCTVCEKDISQEAQQYFSPFKQEHVCVECAEADDQTKVGMQRFKYHDTLIFINGPLADFSVLNDIDDHKIGTNQKLKEGDNGSQLHPMFCSGCGEEEQIGARYISLTALPGEYRSGGYVEYCSKCFDALKGKNSKKAKEIVAKDANNGMVLDSLFTRVLFNYGGYRVF